MSGIKDYPSNSNKSKATQQVPAKNIKPIVTNAKDHKETFGEKAKKTLSISDGKTVLSYLRDEVIVPAIKNSINDLVTNGIQMLLFGQASGSRRSSYYSPNGSRTNYSSYYVTSSSSSSSNRGTTDRVRNGMYSYPLIAVESAGEADDIVAAMGELVSNYDSASVSDLLGLVNRVPRFSDEKWGWTDCRAFHWSRVGRDYVLDFDPPVKLE